MAYQPTCPALPLPQAHIAKYAEKLNATLSDNDDTERLALSPGLWLMARMQVGVGAGGRRVQRGAVVADGLYAGSAWGGG